MIGSAGADPLSEAQNQFKKDTVHSGDREVDSAGTRWFSLNKKG